MLELSAHLLGNSLPRLQHCIYNILVMYIMYVYITAFTATRSLTHGSWFIRVLVATFYKHSYHKDLESLFKIVSCNYNIIYLFYSL